MVSIVVGISLVAAFLITLAIITSPPSPPATAPTITTPEQTSQTMPHRSWYGNSIAFVVVIIVLIAIATRVYHENRDEENKWGAIIRNNAAMTFLGLIVLNAIAYILHYDGWRKFFDTGNLFWITNIGIILFVYLIFEKSTAAKIVAVVLALFILGAVFGTKEKAGSILSHTQMTANLPQGVPVEIAKRVVCECESNCQQFESDGKTPFKNRGIPEKGVKPSSAFGKYQFLEVHRKLANNLKPPLDLNTEDGQEKYFEHLYAKEGFGHWAHDEQFGGGRACWGPKLVALGYSNQQNIPVNKTVEAPVDKWSEEVNNPKRAKVTWGRLDRSKGGTCEVMLNRDPNKVFPITAQTNMGPVVIQFKCSEKGAQIEVLEVPKT